MTNEDKLIQIKNKLVTGADDALSEYLIATTNIDNSHEDYYTSVRYESEFYIYKKFLTDFFRNDNLEEIFSQLKANALLTIKEHIENYERPDYEKQMLENLDTALKLN